MVEYLDKLVQNGEWQQALDYADRLLGSDVTEGDMTHAYCTLCVCRFHLADYAGAVVAGEIALVEAERLGLWDLFAQACLNLSATYDRMGDLVKAEGAVYSYLSHLPKYSSKPALAETSAWYNLGIFHSSMGRNQEAAKDYTNGLTAAIRYGMHRDAHGIRQALIQLYLRLGTLDAVPRLLAQCAEYLRHVDTTVSANRTSLFFHHLLRIEHAMVTHRIRRARTLALRALADSEGEPRHQFYFHMQLAKMAERSGAHMDAVGHSMAARIYAAQCRRHDLEAEATTFMYDVTARHPESVEKMDPFHAVEG